MNRSTMRYVLRTADPRQQDVELSESEFIVLKKARITLNHALEIEELYEIVIITYEEFEKALWECSSQFMIRDRRGYDHLFGIRVGINVRILSFLSSARMYTDQVKHHVKYCLPNGKNAQKQFKALLSSEYDQNPNYRFMEALRNHVQHGGLPVHQTTQSSRWTSLEGDGLLEFNTDAFSRPDYLAKNPKFKRAVLSELGGTVDLKEAVRSYLESLSSVHNEVRAMISKAATSSRKVVEDSHSRFTEVNDDGLIDLRACELENEEIEEQIPLFLSRDDVRLRLLKRNRQLVNLSKRYVTGVIKPKADSN